ncbi:TLD-domain-containing protein [Mycena amicta]|nr:TLD-domain-containing protein [Mycena amicta]
MADSTLDAFPALVPTRAAQKDQEAEQAFDKFANLFLPPTPRASPVPTPLALSAPPPQTPQSTMAASPDSEFGSFVSVSATQDPLSSSLAGFDPFTPIEAESGPSSVSVFEKTVKDRAETNRGLLDELLMHEDEPMYWLNEQPQQAQSSSPQLQSHSTPQPPPPPLSFDNQHYEEDPLPSQKHNKWMTESLSDLDFDFFASLPPQQQPSLPPKPHRRSSSHSSVHSATRSPTQTSARTLAPPLASTSTSEDAPGFELRHSRMSPPTRSGSYAALTSSLSKSAGAKWVASFLPSALSPPATTVPNTSLFPPLASSSSSPAPSPSSSLANSLVLPGPGHHHHTPASTPTKVPDLSHFTPFAPAHANNAYVPPTGAPGFRGDNAYDWDKGFSQALERELDHIPEGEGSFESGSGSAAVHVRVLTEDDWDDDEDILILDGKGNATRVGGPSRTPSSGSGGGHIGNGNGNGNGLGAGKAKDGVGVLLEKKMTLSISLEGRRDTTTRVLTNELVALIHPHLSALLRLPRKWTLLYSLDQHGISLKTLYARSAPATSSRSPQPKGGLLAIQDSDGAVFGAWVPDGLKRNVGGGYYGGGESFLWRYFPSSGKFDVFKWTGKNDYVALCEEGFISFGGGDGNYGLYLDDSLLDGSSARCLTFDNEPLCSPASRSGQGKSMAKFECVGLEVWGVGP